MKTRVLKYFLPLGLGLTLSLIMVLICREVLRSRYTL